MCLRYKVYYVYKIYKHNEKSKNDETVLLSKIYY